MISVLPTPTKKGVPRDLYDGCSYGKKWGRSCLIETGLLAPDSRRSCRTKGEKRQGRLFVVNAKDSADNLCGAVAVQHKEAKEDEDFVQYNHMQTYLLQTRD